LLLRIFFFLDQYTAILRLGIGVSGVQLAQEMLPRQYADQMATNGSEYQVKLNSKKPEAKVNLALLPHKICMNIVRNMIDSDEAK
jgi:hypothetical protein